MEQIGVDQREFEKFNRMTKEERKKWVEEETEKRIKFHQELKTRFKAVFEASGESE